MKPGRSAETMTCLPSSAARSRTAASVASSVAVPRMSSISGITGTGLKKCMPTNRARRPSATVDGQPVDGDRRGVRWRRRRPAGRCRRARPTARDLTSRSSNTASTTRSASAAAARSSVGDEARQRRVAVLRGEPALRDGPVEVAGDPVAAGLGARQLRLVQGHLLADRRVDLGDAVPHQPGAGDEHALDRSCARAYAARIADRERGASARTAAPHRARPSRHPRGRRRRTPDDGARPPSTAGAIPNDDVEEQARRPDDRSPLRLGDARDRQRQERRERERDAGREDRRANERARAGSRSTTEERGRSPRPRAPRRTAGRPRPGRAAWRTRAAARRRSGRRPPAGSPRRRGRSRGRTAGGTPGTRPSRRPRTGPGVPETPPAGME